ADMFVELKRRAAEAEEIVAAGLYNPPEPADRNGEAAMLELGWGDLGVGGHYAVKSPRVVIDELFETPELRALLYRCSVEWGMPVDTDGLGAGFFSYVMWTLGNWKLCRGGTHTL